MIDFRRETNQLKQTLINVYAKASVLTSRLKVLNVSKHCSKKKIVISNRKLLVVSGMSEGSKYVVETSDGVLRCRAARPSDTNVKTVSYRTYAKREGYVEQVIDLRHQEDIRSTIGDSEFVHVTFLRDEVIIKPLDNASTKAVNSKTELRFDLRQEEGNSYSGLLHLVELLKTKDYSRINVSGYDGFSSSRECMLLTLQLRRKGYSISIDDSENIKAEFNRKPTVFTEIVVSRPSTYVDTLHRDKVLKRSFAYPNLSTFTACSSGVDMHLMEKHGFDCSTVIDFRPNESRDLKKINGVPDVCQNTGEVNINGRDKTDSGILSALNNVKSLNVALNEDIYYFDLNNVRSYLASNYTHYHASLQCDCFSPLKTLKARQGSIDNLDTTVDMFFEHLHLLRSIESPTAMFENVATFLNTCESDIFMLGLKQMGYSVKADAFSAPDYNGLTNRNRAYFIGTMFSDISFEFPKPVKRIVNAWNDVIKHNLDHFKEINSLKTIKEAIKVSRSRFIKEGCDIVPTLVKSQFRYAKDSVFYAAKDGTYYSPDPFMMQKLMGIGDEFDTSFLGNEALSAEIIGQSIEASIHEPLLASLLKHINKAFHGVKGGGDMKLTESFVAA